MCKCLREPLDLFTMAPRNITRRSASQRFLLGHKAGRAGMVRWFGQNRGQAVTKIALAHNVVATEEAPIFLMLLKLRNSVLVYRSQKKTFF